MFLCVLLQLARSVLDNEPIRVQDATFQIFDFWVCWLRLQAAAGGSHCNRQSCIAEGGEMMTKGFTFQKST
jgi:hypothetical protein